MKGAAPGDGRRKRSPSVFKMPPGKAQRRADARGKNAHWDWLLSTVVHSCGNEPGGARQLPQALPWASASGLPQASSWGVGSLPVRGRQDPVCELDLRKFSPPRTRSKLTKMSRTNFSRALDIGQKLATTLGAFVQEKERDRSCRKNKGCSFGVPCSSSAAAALTPPPPPQSAAASNGDKARSRVGAISKPHTREVSLRHGLAVC